MRNQRLLDGWTIIGIIVNIFLFLLTIFNINYLTINLTLIIWTNMIIYCLADISKRMQIMVFLIAFFAFLMGRQLLETYGLHAVESVFSDEITLFSERLVLISLTSFSVFTLIFNRLKVRITIRKLQKRIPDHHCNYNSQYYKTIQKYSKIGFYITYMFGLYSIFQIVFFVFKNGYLAFFSSYNSQTPYVIEKLGELSVLFFWIFLATLPDKKKIIFPTILFLLRSIMTLGTGQRFEFIATILTLMVYVAMRNKTNNGEDLWINRKTIIIGAIAAPLLILSMNYYNYIRLDQNYNFEHILDVFTDFFYRQGVTINVLKRYKLYESNFPAEKIYMLSNTSNIIRNKPIGMLLGMKRFSGNSVEYATQGSSLAHTLSYIVLKNRYINGEGLGSSYIAETFHDLSYPGLIIINGLYAFLLCKVIKIDGKSIWGCTFALLMLSSVLFAIRGETDGFMSIYLNISTWFVMIMFHLLGKGRKTDS